MPPAVSTIRAAVWISVSAICTAMVFCCCFLARAPWCGKWRKHHEYKAVKTTDASATALGVQPSDAPEQVPAFAPRRETGARAPAIDEVKKKTKVASPFLNVRFKPDESTGLSVPEIPPGSN